MDVFLALASLLVAAAVAAASGTTPEGARAELRDAGGKLVGSAVLVEQSDGVRIVVQGTGLAPGVHGIHIHEKGSCQGPGFETAGAHFNPTGRRHGAQNPEGPHLGDLPNVEADEKGNFSADLVLKDVTLRAGPNALLRPRSTAVVIHEKADDYRTDPSGESGGRLACGVIIGSEAKAPAGSESPR